MQVICSSHVYLDRNHPDVCASILMDGDSIKAVRPGRDAFDLSVFNVRDFGDAFICPGFHDAHQHVFHTALFGSDLALSYVGTSEADCVRHLAAFAASHPSDGWLIGQGWRSDLWDPPMPPTRASLDAAFSDRPVCMYAGDLHTLWLNTAGMARLGITDESEPPAGGAFDRDASGELTGVIREAAGMYYVSKVFASLDAGQVRSIYRDYFERSLSLGVTSVCDMALCAIPGVDFIFEDVYASLLEAGEVTMRVHLFPQNIGDYGRARHMHDAFEGQMVQVRGTKQFFDGVSSAHTAWMTAPYANPYYPGDHGRPTVDPELMRSYVLDAASQGIPTRIHTIGDEAIHTAIAIFREALERYGKPLWGRDSIEHIESLTRQDVEAMGRIGLVASVQPQHIVIDVDQPARDLGSERASFMWPFSTYLASGVPMAFGTDSPCVPDRPMEVLSCAVTREDPATCEPHGGWLASERIGMADAIDAYTHGSAYVVGRERELGRLQPGLLADIVVLDRGLMSANPETIQGTSVLATYVGGGLVWER